MTSTQALNVHGVALLFESEFPQHLERLREDYGGFFVEDAATDPLLFVVATQPPTIDVGAPRAQFDGVLGDHFTVGERGVLLHGPQAGSPPAYEAEVRAYFTATVLNGLVTQRGGNLFHSSSVVGSHGAVMLAGAKKMGKSSLAMLCSLDGAEYMSNDMSVLTTQHDAGLSVMGLPQPISLAPGAMDWFSRRRAMAGIGGASTTLDESLDAMSRYVLEVGDKSRIGRPLLSQFTTVRHTAAPLGALVFPEPGLTLAEPRARLLHRDEAAARLAMLAETFLKWSWPVPLSAEQLLDRSRSLILSAVDSVPSYHLQWCADHDRNIDLLRELVL